MTYGADKLKLGLNFDFKLNLTLKVKVDCLQNNKDLNQGVFAFLVQIWWA